MSKQAVTAISAAYVLELFSQNPDQTIEIGQQIGEHLQRGDLVLLMGDLGTGKTHLVRGIVQGLGSSDLVTSPTFVLINEYRAGALWQGMPIYHADLYRIEDVAELAGMGLEELLWTMQAVCLVEWAEHGADRLPAEHLAVSLNYGAETGRVLRLLPNGTRYQQLVRHVEQALAQHAPQTLRQPEA